MTDVLMYHATPRSFAAAFERHMRFLSSLYDIVPLARALEPPGVRRRIVLTFDDGLRNNVAVAYPVLKKLGLPATFFVCPELIDRGCWLWNQEARARLAAQAGAPANVEGVIELMKKRDLRSRRRMEEEIRSATPFFAPSAEQRELYDLASWRELLELDPAIVTVGSHTLTHPILPSLSETEVEHEIAGSRARLEERLQRPVEYFCYPNGDRDAAVVDCARRHYRGAVTTIPGRAQPGCDPHLVPRWSAPGTLVRMARILQPWPQSQAAGTLAAGLRALTWMVCGA